MDQKVNGLMQFSKDFDEVTVLCYDLFGQQDMASIRSTS